MRTELRQNMKTAESYARWLRDFEPRTLQTKHAKITFWINTYNMLTLHSVESRLKKKPNFSQRGNRGLLQRIRFFWLAKHTIGGRRFSLYQIENRILRKMDEPRIHFALNCASASCPVLKNSLYSEDSLERELENAASTFIQSPRGAVIDRHNGTVRLSRIFKWYRRDFKQAAGSVLKYIRTYLPEDDGLYVDSHISTLSIEYMQYDWNLLYTNPATREPQ